MTHYVGVERDITEELKLRDQLVHSERLSAIGELVAVWPTRSTTRSRPSSAPSN